MNYENEVRIMKLLISGDYSPEYVRGQLTPDSVRDLLLEIRPLLDAADYRVTNLESVLTEEGVGERIPKTGPNLRGAPSDLCFITEGNFDVAVLANNHFGDFGAQGVLQTLKLLDDAGIRHIGGGTDVTDAYRSVILEKDGVRVSLLAVCENEFGCATQSTPGAAGFDMPLLARRIAQERARADHVVVIFHGGNEYNPLPAPAAQDRYRAILDYGADALIGGHTHCIQGYEIYKGKPLVYSMGNFFFPDSCDDPNSGWFYGYLSELNVTKEGITLHVHPYRLTSDNRRVHLFTGVERDRMLAYIDTLSAFLSDRDMLTRYFEGWCLFAGVDYANCVHYDHAYERSGLSFEERTSVARIRNLFTCESHNYLMRTLLCLEMENRFDEAKPYLEKVTALQKLPV